MKKPIKIHPVLQARFAAHLKELRIERGWTHEQFAPMAGISGPYVSMLEAGLRTPSFEIVEKCAKALRVDPAVLLKEIKA